MGEFLLLWTSGFLLVAACFLIAKSFKGRGK